MKLFFIIGMLCINNVSSPTKPSTTSRISKKEIRPSYKLAPSILIVATY
ncbi:MAG: hypothetical protein JWR72_672 [Flavisolibacter sp.]|jgi:hypothetical protein|nr:hypothetical protein [Flavisolibacter sp.]